MNRGGNAGRRANQQVYRRRKHPRFADDLIRRWSPPTNILPVRNQTVGPPAAQTGTYMVAPRKPIAKSTVLVRQLSPTQRSPVVVVDRVQDRAVAVGRSVTPAVSRTSVVLLRRRLDTASVERRTSSRAVTVGRPVPPSKNRVVLLRNRLDNEARQRRTNSRAIVLGRPIPPAHATVTLARTRLDTASVERRTYATSKVAVFGRPLTPSRVTSIALRTRLDTAAVERRTNSRAVTLGRPVAPSRVTVTLLRTRLDTAGQARRTPSLAVVEPTVVAPRARVTSIALRQRLDTAAVERRTSSRSIVPPRPVLVRSRTSVVLLPQRLDTSGVVAPPRRIPSQAFVRPAQPVPAPRTAVVLHRRRLDTAAVERRTSSRAVVVGRPVAPARLSVTLHRRRLDNEAFQRRTNSRAVVPAVKQIVRARATWQTAQAVPHTGSAVVTTRRIVNIAVKATVPIPRSRASLTGAAYDVPIIAQVVSRPPSWRRTLVAPTKPVPATTYLSVITPIHEPADYQRPPRLWSTAQRPTKPIPAAKVCARNAAVQQRVGVIVPRVPTRVFPTRPTRPLAAPRTYRRNVPTQQRVAPIIVPRVMPRVTRCPIRPPLTRSRARGRTYQPYSATVALFFSPPTVEYVRKLSEQGRLLARVSHVGNELAGHYATTGAYSVLRIDGEYQQMIGLTEDLMATASEVYVGGHRYPIDQATADRLAAAGYTVEAVPA